MGTSLSGLTPATTFDGLLKTSDNEPLDGTLKTISDGSGVDSVLQLSDSALSIGGTFDVDGGIATFKGVSNSSSTSSFIIKNSADSVIFRVRDDQQIFATYLNGQSVSASLYALYGADYAANIRVNIKGSGATSATTSLLVQNSNGADVLQTLDNGSVGVGGPANSSYRVTMTSGVLRLRDLLFGQTGTDAINNTSLLTMKWNGSTGIGISGNGAIDATARLHIKGSGATSATTALLVQNSAGTDMLKVTDDGTINVRSNLFVNHSSVSSRQLRLGWGSIYATDNASELQIGAVYTEAATAPKITLGGKTRSSGADAIQVQTLNGMYIAPTANAEDPSAQLHIKGSGNDATTTALLVQNSDGTDLINVSDNGIIGLNPTDNGAKWELNAANNYILSNVYAHYYDTAGTVNFRNSNVLMGLGTSAASNTRLLIKGSGATSATTALLVQNSAGASAFKIQDDRKAIFSGLTEFSNNVQFLGANDTSSLNNMRFVVPGATKSFVLNADYSNTNDPSALLEVQSTTKGFLPPKMTTTQRDAITAPAAGLMVYNTTTNKAQCYNGTTWNDLF
jgi:hypothetical protein